MEAQLQNQLNHLSSPRLGVFLEIVAFTTSNSLTKAKSFEKGPEQEGRLESVRVQIEVERGEGKKATSPNDPNAFEIVNSWRLGKSS